MADKTLSELAKGAWSGATAYTVADFVTNGGSSYVCILNHTNQEPPNATYWALLASKGTDGTNGTNGTNGSNGVDGVSAGILFAFDDATTDSDPGAGNFRFNHATIASVTQLFLSDTQQGGGDVSPFIATWDDSTNTSLRGYVIVRSIVDHEKFALFSITSGNTTATGYTKVTVTHLASNGSLTDEDQVSITFTRTGDKGIDGAGAGDVVGPASATDGAVVLFDGTTGKLLKNSSIVPTTVGTAIANLSNPSAITFLRINANNTVTALSASDMRTALGLAIGTNVQAWDADLDTWSGIALDTDTTLAADSDTKVASQKAVKAYVDAGSGGTAFWSDVPGTPTRVSDTQFTITDTSNANLYDLLFKKGVILKWLESTTFQTAMVISSSYSSNAVTINIVGDSLTAGFTDMKYGIQMAMKETFIVAGTLSAATDTAKSFYPSQDIYPLSCDARVKTAGTTNATEFDLNDDGTSVFGGTAASIASTATTDIDNAAAAPTTAIVAGSVVTLDTNSVSTTAPIEAYVDLFYFPVSWRYR